MSNKIKKEKEKEKEKEEELSKLYQKKSDKQHVLDNPDTYIGSIENIEQSSYIYNENYKSNISDNNISEIIEKQIKYIPGLYKLFDEAIVNCRDHYVRMQQKIIDSSID